MMPPSEGQVVPGAPEIVVASIEVLAQRLVEDVARELDRTAAASAHPFTLAVPGGSVAEAFLPAFAAAPIDWSRTALFWTDERAVPPTSPDSNYARAARLWLSAASAPPRAVHRMPADAADIAASAKSYARLLLAAAGRPPRLDYVLLGVGEDGHVASLFPGDTTRPGDDAAVGWTDAAPKPPPRRMTLSMRTLTAARRVVVAAFGEGKAPVVAAGLAGSDPALPVARLLRHATRPLLLLDQAAARQLPAHAITITDRVRP